MKNIKKIILVTFLIILSLFLCSCDKLDELKEMRIPITENGLELNGKVYRHLVYCDQKKDRRISGRSSENCIVVDEEVPILLIEMYGWNGSYNKELDIITFDGSYYCSEENYDEYYKTYIYGELDHYKIDHTDYYTQERTYKVLGSDLCAVIEATARGEYDQRGKNPNGVYEYITLDRCDKNDFIKGFYGSEITIFREKKRSKYGVVGATESYYIIPTEYQDKIAELFREYREVVEDQY
ncbi:MAG: hypothetical protein E7574_05050 [Ruminococcaceae bacterium]|nr:hypothetical protein [Oscillospiraceae bacterium]